MEILDFISRRFPADQKWLLDNSYYFAVILKDRFPQGGIYYDVVDELFVFELDGRFYNWGGVVDDCQHLVNWATFAQYDSKLREEIVQKYCT